eukprot:scaffold9273_cov128-Isochrysis_galbana.AAC.4
MFELRGLSAFGSLRASHVASAVFSISILSLDAAKVRPITDTDVQSDGRPLALPRDSHGALPVCDAVAAAGGE